MRILLDTSLILTSTVDRFVDCTYPDDGSAATLDIFADQGLTMYCWTGEHRVYGTLALVLLVYYVLSANVNGVLFLESRDKEDDVRWRESFIVLDRSNTYLVIVAKVRPTAPLYLYSHRHGKHG